MALSQQCAHMGGDGRGREWRLTTAPNVSISRIIMIAAIHEVRVGGSLLPTLSIFGLAVFT